MTGEQNLRANERWVEEVVNQGSLDVLDEIMAENVVDHDPAPDQGPGREGFKQFFTTMGTAFPDLRLTPELTLATDDKVVMRYQIEGIHEGEFMGAAPTGRRFSIAALQIARFEDGVVVERWGSSDELGLLKQLGIVDVG